MANNKNKSETKPEQCDSGKRQASEKNPAELLINTYIQQCYEDGGITKANLKHLAYLLGVPNHETLDSEAELIKAIQKAVQNRPCFRSNTSEDCLDSNCLWKTECKKIIAEWQR